MPVGRVDMIRNGGTSSNDAEPSKKKGPLTKSVSESSLKKRQQGSLLDQELSVLERDEGKRHARHLSNSLLEYAKKIEEMQAKNKRLEEELSFDDNVTRNDPFYNEEIAEKLSNLYMQGNNFMIRLEVERKEIARLNDLIQRSEAKLAHQKSKLYELSALDHNHSILIGKIRKMENDIDRRIVKMNEKLSTNRKLRSRIDAQRAERARMDAIYTKISVETLSKQFKVVKLNEEVEKMRQEVADTEREIEECRQEGEEWEMTCDRRAAVLLQELKEIALSQRDAEELVDADQYEFLGDNELMKHMNAAHENTIRSRMSRSRWKTGQSKVTTDALLTKYQENRSYIEKIQEISGTSTVSEMIEAFNNQEVEHFEHIQHVNQLAEDIENHRHISSQLREEIGKLKQRKESVDFQRVSRVETLKARLQSTVDQKKHKDESNLELQIFLAALQPSVTAMHNRIGCPELRNEGDMKKILGDIEEQVVSVLQRYSAKVARSQENESGSSGGVSTGDNNNENTSPSRHLGTDGPARRRMSRRASFMKGNRSHPSVTRRPSSMLAQTAAKEELSPSTSPLAGGHPPPLPLTTTLDLSGGNTGNGHVASIDSKAMSAPCSIASLHAKEQPYRYGGLKPPHLSVEELKKKDNMEEEYPLTYNELKVKVWRGEST